MKRIYTKFQWYNIIIVVCVCILSLLCWLNFAWNVGAVLISHFTATNNAETINENATYKSDTDNVELSNDTEVNDNYNEKNYLEYIDMLDSCINKFDSTWYNCMFKKSYVCKVDSLYTYYLTGEIASNQVLKGKGNWLFYKSSTDGNPIGDFEGTNRYSSSEMNNILNQAIATQEELNLRGIKLAILVAPNKENIYAEYMPDTYTHSDTSSTDILIDYLANNGVNVISPKQELLDNNEEFQLYYYYDTHWNQLGAYIGVRSVLESWNISVPALTDRSISSHNLADNYHSCGEDDLAKMVGMREMLFYDEIEYEVDGTGIMDWKQYSVDEGNKETSYLSYYNNPAAQMKATLLLVGDSFRTSMIPLLRETYSDVYVVHRSNYSTEILEEINPEYIIAEYVERYSSNIGKIGTLVK